MTHRDCPVCCLEGGKVLRLEGSYEPDTNSYPYPVQDTRLSCSCDLTADQVTALMADVTMEDFIDDRDE